MLSVYRVGYVAKVLGVKSNTVRKWEALGVIAEPLFRSGKVVAYRSYTKEEVELIHYVYRQWWDEHWELTGKAVPKPHIWRYGQIYWYVRKARFSFSGGNTHFSLKEIELPPRLHFNPKDIVIKGKGCIMDVAQEIGQLLRNNEVLRSERRSVRVRSEFFEKLYSQDSKEGLLDTINEYNNMLKELQT
jgi:hypothetical protein